MKLIISVILLLFCLISKAQTLPETLPPTVLPKITVPIPKLPTQTQLNTQVKTQISSKIPTRQASTSFIKNELGIDTTINKFKTQKQYFKSRIKNRYGVLRSLIKSEIDTAKNFKLPSFLKFNGGQAALLQQFSDREGNYPVNNPGSFTRLTVNAGVSVFGLPLKMQLIRTTEQGFLPNQPINRFTLGLDMITIEQNFRTKAQAKLTKLEKELYMDDMKELDKLYNFYTDNDIPFLDSKKLNSKLDKYSKDKLLDSTLNANLDAGKAMAEKEGKKQMKLYEDSIKRLPAHLQKEGEKELRRKTKEMGDTLTKKGKKKLEKKAKKQSQKYAQKKTKLEKRAAKENKKIKKYLVKNNISEEKLKNIQKSYDSLKTADPMKIAGYETYAILKAFKDGNTTDGIQKLSRYGALGLPEIIFGSIKKFEVGTSNPTFSDYTLRGVPIKGVNIELEPAKWHIAYAGKKNMEAIASQNVYERELQAGKIGYGKTDKSHIRLIYLQGIDGKGVGGDLIGLPLALLPSTPQKNYVLALKGKLILSKTVNFEGEVARSFTSTNLYKKDLSFSESYNNFFNDVISDSTIKIGNAANLKLNLQIKKNTKLQLKTEYISGNFHTLGAPYMRNDMKGYQAEIEQTIPNSKITLSGTFGQSYDNLSGQKTQTTYVNTYGIKFKWTPKKLPFVMIDYRLNKARNTSLNTVHVLNANIIHKYKVNNKPWQTSLVISMQNTQNYELGGQNLPPNALPLYQAAKIYTIVQTFGFSFPMQAQLNISLRDIQGGVENGFWKAFTSEVGYTFKGKWKNTCAGSYAYASMSTKYDFSLASEITFLKKYSFLLKVQKTVLGSTIPLQNYKENLFIAGLNARF